MQLVVGTLKPLIEMLLHAALGIFVSVLMRSSGAAVAMSYGAVLVVRIVVWLANLTLGTALIFGLLLGTGTIEPASGSPSTGIGPALLSGLFSALPPLVVLFVELLGAAGLVWGAIQWLKRG